MDAVIADPAPDPHSFEPSPRAQLALSKAALVIENGGGYDDFMETMLAASGRRDGDQRVNVPGKTAPSDGELNEHVWYDFPTVATVATRIADELTTIDPSAGASFGANLAAFQRQVGRLTTAVEAIKAAHGGAAVAITEPVPLYLLTPPGW